MSHVMDREVPQGQRITRLDVLGLALAGHQHLELVLPDNPTAQKGVGGKLHYRTWKDAHGGRLMGDYPVPAGMTAEEVGENADAVIRVKDLPTAYEVGLVRTKAEDGTVHYKPYHDFFAGGLGLEDHVGRTVIDRGTGKVTSAYDKLMDAYLMYYQAVAVMEAANEIGHDYTLTKLKDGSLAVQVDSENVGV